MLPSDAGDLGEEARRIFSELDRSGGATGLTGECAPAIDVFESDDALEVFVDLPGVAARAIRIVVKGQTLLVAGEKAPRRGRGDASFHLVERGFGRFASAVRLSVPCNAAAARALLVNGELRITLPKIVERRGRAIQITI